MTLPNDRMIPTEKEQKAPQLHTALLGLQAFCKANKELYKELGMEIESKLFDHYVRRIEEEFPHILAQRPDA